MSGIRLPTKNLPGLLMARTTQFVLRSRRIGEVGQLERPLAVFLRNTLLKLAPASLQAKQLLQMLAFTVDG